MFDRRGDHDGVRPPRPQLQLTVHPRHPVQLRVGSGTVSNKDTARGYSCIAEKRALEMIADGKPTTPFMRYGDSVRIDMLDAQGASIFGAIEQTVAAPARR